MSTIQTKRAGGASKLALGADGEVNVEEADLPFSELSASYEPDEPCGDLVAETRASRAPR